MPIMLQNQSLSLNTQFKCKWTQNKKHKFDYLHLRIDFYAPLYLFQCILDKLSSRALQLQHNRVCNITVSARTRKKETRFPSTQK